MHVQGGPAQDMDQLKEAVSSAAAGTGEVQRVIRESSFQPRAAAFTSLIQQCARVRAWQKAVDVFQALQETPGLKVCRIHPKSVSEGSQAVARWSFHALQVLAFGMQDNLPLLSKQPFDNIAGMTVLA